ncbi:hypothetical protein NIES2100_41950 [Calothrix sp. NIES-2100]|uniref:AAA-like domain-containing protein n=1 Tax=Calothrix sp. NIES-2100 TaxID=1954172 RepID=UPI000B5F9F20|nr:hypothetical protein NIES2100_41950 [Calothrix sp. NIES-2100]
MGRSFRVRTERIDDVKNTLLQSNFASNSKLAEALKLSKATIDSFFRGTAIDKENFDKICEALNINRQDIAITTDNSSLNSPKRSLYVKKECIDDLKKALLRNGFISQTDLAGHLGLSESTINSFFRGKAIDRNNFDEICKALSVSRLDIAAENTPADSLEYPEGEVPLNSYFYIQRFPIEQRCYEEISKPGSLIRIKAPQQTGKSSLLVKILHQANSQGDMSVTIDFRLAESELFGELNTFLRWFCDNLILEITKENQELQTKLLSQLDEHWNLARRIGSMKTCMEYFEQYLFPEIPQRLTLALEEVDKVFEYPKIYKDFFGLLRSLHEEAKRRDIWTKLRLVIVHSTEAYVPMNIHQSPFNVGLVVELPEFTQEQVKDLAQRHQLNLSDAEIERLIEMVGGQPFLIRLALYKIANQETTISQLLQTASTTSGIFSNYLRRIESILKQQPQLEAAMKELLFSANSPVFNNEVRYKLRALGLVKLQGDEITLSSELYRQYFQNL